MTPTVTNDVITMPEPSSPHSSSSENNSSGHRSTEQGSTKQSSTQQSSTQRASAVDGASVVEKPTAEPATEVFAVYGVEPEIQAYAMAKYSRSALSMKESLREISSQKA